MNGRVASMAMGDESNTAEGTADRATRAAWFALWVLLAVLILRYVDQVVLTIGTEPMRRALNLSDTQLGLLNGLGFTLAAAIGSVPLAWLADRFDRRWVLAACIGAWSAATGWRGLAQNFEQLLASTAGLSLAEAGLMPIAYAMIPSLFHGRQRATANLIFYAGGALGYSAAMMLGGMVFKLLEAHSGVLPQFVQGLESWRTASFAVAIVGPAFAALVLCIRDRKTSSATTYPPARASATQGELRDYLRVHWHACAGVFGSSALGAAGLSPLMAWIAPAAARQFGLSPAEVGTQVGAVFLAATMTGIALAGLLQRRWGRRYGDMLPVCAAPYLTAFSALPLAVAPFATSEAMLYAAVFVVLVCLIAFNAGMPTVYQSIAPAGLRARVLAGGAAAGTIFSSLGPIAVGAVSDALAAKSNGLLLACAAIGVPLTLLSAATMYWGSRHIAATLKSLSGASMP